MKVLAINPKYETLEYGAWEGNGEKLLGAEKGIGYRGEEAAAEAMKKIISRHPSIDIVAVRIAFAGSKFSKAEVYTSEIREQLQRQVAQSPVYLPAVLTLLDKTQEVLPEKLIVLVFDTAFFCTLPDREAYYALDPGLSESEGFRRTGFHGLFHESAMQHTHDKLRDRDRTHPLKIMSICLEPRPEISAIVGRRPLTVTSGSTPMEGLPGETICGEIDASIILTLAEKSGFGTEQINNILTRESGLAGFEGSCKKLDELLDMQQSDLVRDLFRYKVLQACGAGIAAMSGLDAVVFSGRYAQSGEALGEWLRESLFDSLDSIRKPEFLICRESLEEILVWKAMGAWLETGNKNVAD